MAHKTATLSVSLLAFPVLASACAHGPLPTQHEAQPLNTRPPIYVSWWQEVENCAGRSGSIDEVSWYTVPGAFVIERDILFNGYWYKVGNIIVLPEKRLSDPFIVRHEMLHALLRIDYHSREFTRDCATLVWRTSP